MYFWKSKKTCSQSHRFQGLDLRLWIWADGLNVVDCGWRPVNPPPVCLSLSSSHPTPANCPPSLSASTVPLLSSPSLSTPLSLFLLSPLFLPSTPLSSSFPIISDIRHIWQISFHYLLALFSPTPFAFYAFIWSDFGRILPEMGKQCFLFWIWSKLKTGVSGINTELPVSHSITNTQLVLTIFRC